MTTTKPIITIIQAQWLEHQQILREIRQQVFVIEQGVSPVEEWDDQDEQATHFLAKVNHQYIGCARLLPSGKLTRMAVLSDFRHSGIGNALMQTLINHAKQRGFSHVRLHAQLQALDFYLKHGFALRGDVFTEANIPHQEMILMLSAAGCVNNV